MAWTQRRLGTTPVVQLISLHALRFLSGFLLWSWASVGVAATYKDCLRLYRTKQFTQAATCFETVARSLQGPQLTVQQRIRKGRALRSAATLLERAAKKSPQVEVAAYQRARAVEMLEQYLREKLYEAPYQKKNAELGMLKLRRAIGYASLTLVPGESTARLFLKGYYVRIKATGTWSQNVRPGPYELKVFYPSTGQTIARRFFVSPGKNKVITLRPPQPPVRVVRRQPPPRVMVRRIPPPRLVRRQPPPPTPQTRGRTAAWVTLGIGAATMLGGGAVLIAAAVTDSQKLSLHQQELSKDPTQRGASASADIIGLHQTSSTLFPVGWIVLGAGAATAATGGLLFLAK